MSPFERSDGVGELRGGFYQVSLMGIEVVMWMLWML